MYYRIGKRIFDIVVSLTLILLTAPFVFLLSALILIKLGRPIIFKQQRPGLYGEPFTLHKFRTMTNTCDAQGELLPDRQRITPFGAFLRSTSLDELPELWDILWGTMSFVGPRPLLMEYLTRYTPEQRRRHDVLPGLTGWAQVSGRNAIDWEEKFALDVWYVDNGSFWLDLVILWRTVGLVLGRKGINEAGQATVQKFMGSAQ